MRSSLTFKDRTYEIILEHFMNHKLFNMLQYDINELKHMKMSLIRVNYLRNDSITFPALIFSS